MSERARPAFCLIVEDDPVVGLGLADALDPGKWYIAGPFKYGRDVLCWLSRFTPDVAVVDLSLADGWLCCTRARFPSSFTRPPGSSARPIAALHHHFGWKSQLPRSKWRRLWPSLLDFRRRTHTELALALAAMQQKLHSGSKRHRR